jgi:excisionase family DNA binding protein
MSEPLLTVEELSAWLRLAPQTIRNYVSAKRIPTVHLGRRCLFDPAEVRRWIEANTQRERDLSSVLDQLGRRRPRQRGRP